MKRTRITSYMDKLLRTILLALNHEMTGEKIKKELYRATREIGNQKIQKDIHLIFSVIGRNVTRCIDVGFYYGLSPIDSKNT